MRVPVQGRRAGERRIDVACSAAYFDPRQNFRRIQWRDFDKPDDDLALATGLSEEEAGRLPLIGFPVIAGPVPPGAYRAWVYWTLSEAHNDGLGLEAGDFLPAGDSLIARPPLVVLP